MSNLTPPLKRAGFIEFDQKRFDEPPPDGTEWRCQCGQDLFGIFKGGQLHIKYRERHAFIPEGIVRCRCRSCGNESVIDIGSQGVGVVITHSADPNYLEKLRDALTVSAEIDVSPAARKLAEKHEIDLKDVEGTGKDGRIIKRDVEAVLPQLLYTIGYTETYVQGLREAKEKNIPFLKKGRTSDYEGGSIWLTFKDAEKHAKAKKGYSVFGVKADNTMIAKNPYDDWYDLLTDAEIVQL